MTADRLVFLVVLLGGSFAFGMDVGHYRAKDQLAVTCVAQPGETLIATHQRNDGSVTCSFAKTYGSATRKRKAS